MSCLTPTSRALLGSLELPADKSIAHRAILFSSLANGESVIRTHLLGRDNLASLRIIEQLGVSVETKCSEEMYELAVSEQIVSAKRSSGRETCIRVNAEGRDSFKQPRSDLYCGNSAARRLAYSAAYLQRFPSKQDSREMRV